jgi:hypothetical protein
MRKVSDTKCRENQNEYFMLNNVFPKNHTVCEINVGKYGRCRQVTEDT